MRTTLNIDEHLYQAAKLKAAEEGKPLTWVVEEALRGYLQPRKQAKPFKLQWVTRRGTLMPGVNPDDRDSLYDVMDGRR